MWLPRSFRGFREASCGFADTTRSGYSYAVIVEEASIVK